MSTRSGYNAGHKSGYRISGKISDPALLEIFRVFLHLRFGKRLQDSHSVPVEISVGPEFTETVTITAEKGKINFFKHFIKVSLCQFLLFCERTMKN